MKRFLLFVGDYYYPSGGWYDLQDSFDTVEIAKGFTKTGDWTWFHIVDSQTGIIVLEGKGLDIEEC
jgi:hypothetical protein